MLLWTVNNETTRQSEVLEWYTLRVRDQAEILYPAVIIHADL